jgi:hypothetical protein
MPHSQETQEHIATAAPETKVFLLLSLQKRRILPFNGIVSSNSGATERPQGFAKHPVDYGALHNRSSCGVNTTLSGGSPMQLRRDGLDKPLSSPASGRRENNR